MELNYFQNKICTVITRNTCATNLNPADKTFINIFTGKVIFIDNDYVWLEHIITKAKSMFVMDHIICVLEEQTISSADPAYPELKENWMNRNKPPEKPKPFVGIESLTKQASQIKEKFDNK